MSRNSIHPATPLISGLITSLAFLSGAAAFEIGRAAAEADPRPAETWTASAEPAPPAASISPQPVESTVIDTRPVVALVMDDAGIDPQLTRRAMALDIPLTLSFLPYAEQTPELAVMADARGHAVFLHMPMEPFGLEDPGPGALNRYLPPVETARRIEAALARVPGAIGLNNHMGSAFTADADAMRAALVPLAGRDLIFLDSLTTGRSRAGMIARTLGLTTLRRDIFIDHDAGNIPAMLDALVEAAHRNGQAIAIGHPRGGTLDVLEAWLETETARSVRFVTIQVYADRGPQPVRTAGASDESMGLFGGAE